MQRPRVPRPGIPVIREAEILRFPDDEPPTDAGARSTARPPSIHDDDDATELGKLMREVIELKRAVQSLEAAWRSRSQEHETFARGHIQIQKALEELSAAHGVTNQKITVATRWGGLAIGLIEIARVVFAHYFGGH